MKSLLLLPILALVFFASSCRTVPPLDPVTMKPSCKCLPGNYLVKGCCEQGVYGTK
jgi:hypothetical protein